ncbi:pre-mRNA-processing factor 39 [Anaeramoeba ignava]|uniref:Pre-mRNA-processing factor 39 n=1 Tax=Anaeramoeba ignava TaxID=1746090 RepID=A0A9Q0RCR0_ANAIG|nr:pre-mRNA-processing factor 39 [Anaeramoeba ignava]
MENQEDEFQKFMTFLQAHPYDFTRWTQFLVFVEKQKIISNIRTAFDFFLQLFPLTFGYWNKYAELDPENNHDIYERAIKAVPYSVEIWGFYCTFATENLPIQSTRKIFERAIETVGINFLSYGLWNQFINWEIQQEEFEFASKLYQKVIRIPIQQLEHIWESYRAYAHTRPIDELANDEEIREIDEILKEDYRLNNVKRSKAEIDVFRMRALLEKQEKIFKKTLSKVNQIGYYESGIKRFFFHVKPLEQTQLTKWEQYLNFAEEEFEKKEESIEFVIQIYERCLLPTALYPIFWIRYARFLEQNSRIADTREVYTRATQIFLRDKPQAFLEYAEFEERQKEFLTSRSVYNQLLTNIAPFHLETITKFAEFERRMFGTPFSIQAENEEDVVVPIYENSLKDFSTRQVTRIPAKSKLPETLLAIELCRYLNRRILFYFSKQNPEMANKLLEKARRLMESQIANHGDNIDLWMTLIDFEIKVGGVETFSRLKTIFETGLSQACPLSNENKHLLLTLSLDLARVYSGDINEIFQIQKRLISNPFSVSTFQELEKNKTRLNLQQNMINQKQAKLQ